MSRAQCILTSTGWRIHDDGELRTANLVDGKIRCVSMYC